MRLIKNKIFAHIFFPIILVTVSYFVVTNFVLSGVFYGYIEDHSRQSAQKFADSTKENFLTNNPIGLTGQCFNEKYSGLPIKYITIFGKNRNVLAHTHLGDDVMGSESAMILDDITSNFAGYRKYDNDHIYSIDVPVEIGLYNVGLVRVGYDFSVIKKSIINVFYIYIALLILTLLLVMYLSARLTRIIVRPIGELTDSVVAFAGGEKFKKISVTSNDEIGDLGNAFNEMARKIEVAQRQIKIEKSKTSVKIEELEKWQRTTIGREIKMIKLKKELTQLKAKLSKK